MHYIIVTNGELFGSLEIGKPMPSRFWRIGPVVDSKAEAQEWVWDHVEALEAI